MKKGLALFLLAAVLPALAMAATAASDLGVLHQYASVALSADGLSKIVTPIIHGRLAPAGEYRVRVRLREQNREVLSPRSFTLVRS